MVMLLPSPSNQTLSVKRRRSAQEVVGIMIKADVRRGDGVVFSESFPFSCKLCSAVADPGQFPDGTQDFRVYNDDWYDET